MAARNRTRHRRPTPAEILAASLAAEADKAADLQTAAQLAAHSRAFPTHTPRRLGKQTFCRQCSRAIADHRMPPPAPPAPPRREAFVLYGASLLFGLAIAGALVLLARITAG